MCKIGIYFNDELNVATNIPFIDGITNALRDSKDKEEGYLPEEYKNVIIPMLVITRLDLVLRDVSDKIFKRAEQIKNNNNGKLENDKSYIDDEKRHIMLKTIAKREFYNTSGITMEKLANSDPDNRDKLFKEYLDGYSDNVKTLLQRFKFYDEIDKMKKCHVLNTVIRRFWDNRDLLDPVKVDDTAIGNMFEMVIRKYFATSANGQFFTSREIIMTMVNIILNSPDIDENKFKDGSNLNILDMACGTGGMLSVAHSTLKQVNPNINVNLFGQELDPKLHAVCVSDILIKGQSENNVKCANTLYEDCFPNTKMDFILANSPFGTDWKPSGSKKDENTDNLKKQYAEILKIVELGDNGKYSAGIPSDGTDCQIMFFQHALWKLKDGGKACIISNNKPLFTGDVGSGESNIRKWILDNDYLEAIIKLPANLFYNTGISTYLNVFTKTKSKNRKGKVLLIDASDSDGLSNFHRTARKSAGDKRNELTKDHCEKIVDMYCHFKNTQYSKVVDIVDFMLMKFATKQAYQCNFAISEERLETFKNGKLYHTLSHGGKLTEEKINILLRTDDEELEDIDRENIEKHNIGIDVFNKIYSALKSNVSDIQYDSLEEFIEIITKALGLDKVAIPTGELDKKGKEKTKKMDMLTNCDNLTANDIKQGFFSKGFTDLIKMIAFDLGIHDEEADILTNSNGEIVFDDSTKDTETIQVTSYLSNSATLELEKKLSDKEKEDKKFDNTYHKDCSGNAWETKMVENYIAKEVTPYAKNTHMIDSVSYGAEYAFNKQFYVYKPLPSSKSLLEEFKALELSISDDLKEILGED